MHRHVLTAHGSIAYLKFRTQKSKRYPYKCSDCNFYRASENVCQKKTCQKNQEMAKGTRFDASLTEKEKSALLDFNNFEVWSGSDTDDKAELFCEGKIASPKTSSKPPDGPSVEPSAETSTENLSKEKSTEGAKQNVKSGVFRKPEETSGCEGFNEDEMQLVPLLETSANEDKADATSGIKAEKTSEQPDVEMTGMELTLGDPIVIKSDNLEVNSDDPRMLQANGKKRNAPFIEVSCPKCGDTFNRTDKLYKHILNHYGKMAYLKARTTPHACMKWECGYCGFYYRHEKYHQSKMCEVNQKFAKAGVPFLFKISEFSVCFLISKIQAWAP